MARDAKGNIKMNNINTNYFLGCEDINERLSEAVAAGDIKTAAELIHDGADPNTRYGWKSCLHWAAEKEDTGMVKLLVIAGADPEMSLVTAANTGNVENIKMIANSSSKRNNFKKICGQALCNAAAKGYLEACRELIGFGADPNGFPEGRGVTVPLIHAVVLDNTELMKMFIEAGVDINKSNQLDETALIWAARLDKEATVKLLLEAGADPNIRDHMDNSAFYHAAGNARADMLRDLMSAGADIGRKYASGNSELTASIITAATNNLNGPDCRKRTGETMEFLFSLLDEKSLSKNDIDDLLAASVWACYMPGVKRMAAAGADLNKLFINRWSPLYIAAERGYSEIIGFLVDNGADINIKFGSKNVLTVAIEAGKTETARMLIQKGMKLSKGVKEKHKLLMKAAKHGHTDMLRFLLEQGADPDLKNAHSETAAMIAAQYDNAPVIEALAEAGADMNAKNIGGETALYMASKRGNSSSVSALLEAGADPSSTDPVVGNALSIAAARERGPICKLLIAHGADPNAADGMGRTALYWAAKHGTVLTMRALLLAGADLNGENSMYAPLDTLQKYHPGLHKKYAQRLINVSPESRRLASEDMKETEGMWTGFEFDM